MIMLQIWVCVGIHQGRMENSTTSSAISRVPVPQQERSVPAVPLLWLRSLELCSLAIRSPSCEQNKCHIRANITCSAITKLLKLRCLDKEIIFRNDVFDRNSILRKLVLNANSERRTERGELCTRSGNPQERAKLRERGGCEKSTTAHGKIAPEPRKLERSKCFTLKNGAST